MAAQQLRTSQQLAKLEEKLNEGKGTKGHKYGIKYQRLDAENKKSGNTAYKLVSEWSPEELAFMKALNIGDQFVVNKREVEYTTAEGTINTIWKLASVADKTTFTPKEKKGYKKKGGYGNDGENNRSAKIGGLFHDAVTNLGQGATTEQIGDKIREFLTLHAELMEEDKKGTFTSKSLDTNQPAQVLTDTFDDGLEATVDAGIGDEFDKLDDIPW